MPERVVSKDHRPVRNILAPRAKSQKHHSRTSARCQEDHADIDDGSEDGYADSEHHLHSDPSPIARPARRAPADRARGKSAPPVSKSESLASIDSAEVGEDMMLEEEMHGEEGGDAGDVPGNPGRARATGVHGGSSAVVRKKQGRGHLTKQSSTLFRAGSKRKRQSAPAAVNRKQVQRDVNGEGSRTHNSTLHRSHPNNRGRSHVVNGSREQRRVTIGHEATRPRPEQDDDSASEEQTDLDSPADSNSDGDLDATEEDDTDFGSDVEGEPRPSKRSRGAQNSRSHSRSRSSHTSDPYPRYSLPSRSSRSKRKHHTSPASRSNPHSRRSTIAASHMVGMERFSPAELAALKAMLANHQKHGVLPRGTIPGIERHAGGPLTSGRLQHAAESDPVNPQARNMYANEGQTGLEQGLDTAEEDDQEEEDEVQYELLEDVEDEQQVRQHSKKLSVQVERAFDRALAASLTGLSATADDLTDKMQAMMLSLGNAEVYKHLQSWRQAEEKLLALVEHEKAKLSRDVTASDKVSQQCHADLERLYASQLQVVRSFENQVMALFANSENRMQALRDDLRRSRDKYKKIYKNHTSAVLIQKEIEMDVMTVLQAAKQRRMDDSEEDTDEDEDVEDVEDEEDAEEEEEL